MKNILNTIFKSLLKLNNKVNTFLTSMLNWTAGRVVSLNHVQHGRHSFKIVLNVILLQNDLKTLLYHTFIYLNQLEVYNNITHKTILVTITDGGGRVYSLHKSILVKPNFNLEEYYDIVNKGLDKILESGSGIDVPEIKYIEILVIDQDKVVNSKLKSPTQRRYYSTITPLQPKRIASSRIASMDIETVEHKGIQQPVIVTLVHSKFQNEICKAFIIKNNLKLESAIKQLWLEVFHYIINESNIKTIFVHNLGGFDGIFIYKYLINSFTKENVSSVIDNDNKFITINLKLKNRSITWLDSYRIFPVSLDELCKVFEVQGKISKYSIEYNNLNIFYGNRTLLNEFINYAKQDSVCLFNALTIAQQQYLNNYSVDIINIVSTSSLSLRIFRSHFLKVNIPILNHNVDEFVRPSYFGGATDYYKAYGTNLKYYDVNSLYPFVMKNPIPLEIIKYYTKMDGISLNSVFGFFLAEIITPEDIKHPLLPYKKDGETIYPLGKFKGVYFSEELKNAAEAGYQIKLISGYEFSKIDLFNSYVDHFYKIKKNSTRPLKFISKLHLNTLYGVFGRRQDLIKTINIHPKDITQYASTHVIKSIIQVSDKMWTLLVHSNLNVDTIYSLSMVVDLTDSRQKIDVKSNVAIASAVTSYARIHMSKFKNRDDYELFYSDTDSIMIDRSLPEELIGKELGLMKDELSGLNIKEAYFLGIKQYGYWYLDESGNRIERSVFAGVKRNSLTFEEIANLFNGKVITKTANSRFFRSLTKLNIRIKDVNTQIVFKPNKMLVNNLYLPIRTIDSHNPIDKILSKWITHLKSKLLKTFNKLKSNLTPFPLIM